MEKDPDKTVETRKVGAEDIIMMRLHKDRFHNCIPSHYTPPIDRKLHYQVALLAQSCESNTFDNHETGRTYELHLWLRVATLNAGAILAGAGLMLPSMHWYALASATSNAEVRSFFKSFGFRPLRIDKIDLREKGGMIAFPEGGQIVWNIAGPGKVFPRIGVRHIIFVKKDGPDAVGHRIDALLSNATMEQLGRVHVQTSTLEPFFLQGDRFAAVIHRVQKLEASVVWREHPE